MRRSLSFAACAVLAAGALPARAQQAVPIRDLTAADVRSVDNFGLILGLRQLTGGKLLVNDAGRRQLVVLDSTLANRKIVIDSTTGSGNSYGPRGLPLVPYLADSTLFIDMASSSLLVIDPRGQIARVTAPPRASDLGLIANGASGVDKQGRLIYRGRPSFSSVPLDKKPAPATPGAPAATSFPQFPDSAPIVRADFDTRQVDTLGRVKQPSQTTGRAVQGPDGKMKMTMTINPLVTVDEWAVLSDGSIAFVRGHDYHIDWIHPDGSTSSTPKLPFDWKRLTDEDKQALVDSARAAQTAQQAAAAKAAADAKNNPNASAMNADRAVMEMGAVKMAAGGGGGGGGGGMTIVTRGADGPPPPGGAMPIMMGPGGITQETEYVPLNQIADYYPAIRSGATRADADGNLWILPTTSAQSKAGELVYDVVNVKGDLFERVRVPAGRSIIGFGRGGIVYLMSGDRTNGFYLERTRIIGGKRVTQ
jgi:hypothetical protein